MPSARYYRDQAKTLLSWARTTKDKAYAAFLRQQAERELEKATGAPELTADLNPLLAEFNDQQMRRDGTELPQVQPKDPRDS